MSGNHRRTALRMRGLATLFAVLALTGVGAWWTAATPDAAHAADESYRTLTSANHPDWMRSVPDATSLAAMSIPGTHETMSIHGGDAVQTQEAYGDSGGTLAAQLKAGIRMIDIRARVFEGDAFTIHHGAVYQVANFTDVLNTAGAFLDQNPSETVLVRLKHECTGGTGSCKDSEGQRSFEDIFDTYRDTNDAAKAHFWAPSVNRDQGAATPTLGEVRGKIVLVVMNGTAGGRMYNYGLSSSPTGTTVRRRTCRTTTTCRPCSRWPTSATRSARSWTRPSPVTRPRCSSTSPAGRAWAPTRTPWPAVSPASRASTRWSWASSVAAR